MNEKADQSMIGDTLQILGKGTGGGRGKKGEGTNGQEQAGP